MAAFSAPVWRRRACARRDSVGKKRHDRQQQFIKDSAAISGLSLLVDWCLARGLLVDFVLGANEYDGVNRRITVSSRSRPEVQLAYLLHECGHALVDSCSSEEKRRRRWGKGYLDTSPGADKTDRHRLEVVDEELEAWYRGEQLAHRLGISLNTVAFHGTKIASMKTYLRWALKEPGWM